MHIIQAWIDECPIWVCQRSHGAYNELSSMLLEMQGTKNSSNINAITTFLHGKDVFVGLQLLEAFRSSVQILQAWPTNIIYTIRILVNNCLRNSSQTVIRKVHIRPPGVKCFRLSAQKAQFVCRCAGVKSPVLSRDCHKELCNQMPRKYADSYTLTCLAQEPILQVMHHTLNIHRVTQFFSICN